LQEFRELRGASGGCQPAPHAFALDRDRERLVERGIALDVDNVVRKLMEHEPGKLGIAPADERGEQRVVEHAERRIRGHAIDECVQALLARVCCIALCVFARIVAAVGDASRDREARFDGLEREFAGDHDVPDRIRTVELRIAAVAAVVGERKIARSELAHRLGEHEPRAQVGRRLRVGKQIGDRPGAVLQVHMAADGLRVIGNRLAGRKRERQEQSAKLPHCGIFPLAGMPRFAPQPAPIAALHYDRHGA
jgi:hypothetical protein